MTKVFIHKNKYEISEGCTDNYKDYLFSDEEEDLLVAWQIMVKINWNKFNMIKVNLDVEMEDIVQQSWIAFQENLEEMRKKSFDAHNIFFRNTRNPVGKMNKFGVPISSPKDLERKIRDDRYLHIAQEEKNEIAESWEDEILEEDIFEGIADKESVSFLKDYYELGAVATAFKYDLTIRNCHQRKYRMLKKIKEEML